MQSISFQGILLFNLYDIYACIDVGVKFDNCVVTG